MPSKTTPLKNSIKRLRKDSDLLVEGDEAKVSPVPLTDITNEIVEMKNDQKQEPNLKSLIRKSIGGKKRVSFGAILSPEYFDKTLPPSTPVRRGSSPGRTPSRRSSVGTALARRPILEEDHEELIDAPPPLLFFDTSNENLLGEKSVGNVLDKSTGSVDKLPSPLQADIVSRDHEKTRLKTPIRNEIEQGVKLKAIKKKLQTPLRKQIEQSHKLKETKKKFSTPLRKEKQAGFKLKSKKKLGTPLRKDIHRGIKLRTKNKQATPVRSEILKGKSLRVTKPKLNTPLQDEIKLGINLKRTAATPIENKQQNHSPKITIPVQKEIYSKSLSKNIQLQLLSPLQQDIAEGINLRNITKKVLQTPVRKEIQSKPALRQTLKKGLNTPVRKQIKQGKYYPLFLFRFRQVRQNLKKLQCGSILRKSGKKSGKIKISDKSQAKGHENIFYVSPKYFVVL